MTTVYLIRHGESEGNERHTYCGWTDVPLTARGVAQAERLAAESLTPRPDHLVCSDLQRAVATADILGRSWGLEAVQEKAFREMHFGAYENRTWEGILEKYPSLAKRWSEDWYREVLPEGESAEVLYGRVVPAYRSLLARWQGACWALVAHSGVIQALLSAELTGGHQAHWRFAPDNARLIRLDYDGAGFVVLKAFNL